MVKGCPALEASVCARWTVRMATRCSSHLLVYSSVSAQGLHTVCTGRHSHPQGYLAGRTGSWSLTGSRSPLCSLGLNSLLTLRAMAPPGCFPLSASFIFKQRWRDSKLHSFSVSNHSFNLFKRTADVGPEAGFAYSNFRDRVSEVYPTDHWTSLIFFLAIHIENESFETMWIWLGFALVLLNTILLFFSFSYCKQLCIFISRHDILYRDKLTRVASALHMLPPLSPETWLLILALAWKTFFFNHTVLAPD